MDSISSDPISKGEEGGDMEVSEAVIRANHVRFNGGAKRGFTAKDRISILPPCVAGKRSSIYRGVTRHRWTGRYEAHLWDKSTWNQNQNKKGKQVYLGAYDDEEAAARAYDLAALKYWGSGTLTNFKVTDYARDVEEMSSFSREEYLVSLRRKSNILARGISKCSRISGNEEFTGGCRVDLTRYIKWWGVEDPGPVTGSPEETRPACGVSGMGKTNWCTEPTSPYRLPRLGIPRNSGTRSVSAVAILKSSAAYRRLQEKVYKMENKTEDAEKKKPDQCLRCVPDERSGFASSSIMADNADDMLDLVFWSSFVLPQASEVIENGPDSTMFS